MEPALARGLGHLGELLRAHGYVPESNFCFAQAERLDPGDPRWPYLQGIGVQSADPEAAIGHLERAVARCGNTPDAPRLTLAEVCLQQGRLDEAEGHFRQVLQDDPGNVRAHLGLGRSALERATRGDAVAHLERSAASRLTEKASRVLLAQAYQQLGDAAAAGRERARALDLPADPPWPDPFLEEVVSLMIGKHARLSRLQTLHLQGREAEGGSWPPRWRRTTRTSTGWSRAGSRRGTATCWPPSRPCARPSNWPRTRLTPGSIWGPCWSDCGTSRARRTRTGRRPSWSRPTGRLTCSWAAAWTARGTGPGRCALRAAVRYMPQQAEPHRELGALLAREGRTEEAAAELRQVLRLQPADAKAKELLEAVSPAKP